MTHSGPVDRPSGVYHRDTPTATERLVADLADMRFRAVRMDCVPALVVLLDALIQDLRTGLGVRGELLGLLRRAAASYARREPGNPLQRAYDGVTHAIDAAPLEAAMSRGTA